MKNRFLLSGLLTFVFLCFMTSINAQCQKSKSSCSKAKTEQTQKSSCTKAKNYSSCAKYKKEHCNKKKNSSSSFNSLNTLVLLGGAAFDNDNNPGAVAGLEYERQVNDNFGLGILTETTLSENTNLKTGIPLSYHFGKRVKVSAGPLANFQQNTVTKTQGTNDDISTTSEKEWNMELGARAGVSYLINVKGLVLAPTARVDYYNETVIPSIGFNVGLGF